MVKEIGSEFWEVDLKKEDSFELGNNYKFFLTGRTALDFIIKDIKTTGKLDRIYMPSYCCYSMVKPFIDNEIQIEFYKVSFEKGKYTYEIDFETKCEAVLIMQYFGYCNREALEIIKKLKKNGITIIEDATHSWFSQTPYSHKTDYVFTSLRKWTGIPCGAIAIKQISTFNIPVPSTINHKYIRLGEYAALLKKQYIEKNKGCKEAFLKLFNQAESLIETDYRNYGLPNIYSKIIKKLDYEKIKNARMQNAKFLIEELKNLKEIDIIFMDDGDVPLFVPIIIQNEKRDDLKQHFINNKIYCPVHWPIIKSHKVPSKEIYNNSLSLVCDQRYDISDMKRIIQCINDFYRRGF